MPYVTINLFIVVKKIDIKLILFDLGEYYYYVTNDHLVKYRTYEESFNN